MCGFKGFKKWVQKHPVKNWMHKSTQHSHMSICEISRNDIELSKENVINVKLYYIDDKKSFSFEFI